jgi:hypothetical protein
LLLISSSSTTTTTTTTSNNNNSKLIDDLSEFPLGKRIQEYRRKWRSNKFSNTQLTRLESLGFPFGGGSASSSGGKINTITTTDITTTNDNDDINNNIGSSNKDLRGFEITYLSLETYKSVFGHVNVETSFVVPTSSPWQPECYDFKLGQRLAEFRRNRNGINSNKGKIRSERIKKLSLSGWIKQPVGYFSP